LHFDPELRAAVVEEIVRRIVFCWEIAGAEALLSAAPVILERPPSIPPNK
jgi:hypothetical protein